MCVETGVKAPVALAGCHGEQPVLGIELLDQRPDPFEQRLSQGARQAQVAKADLVGFHHGLAFVVARIGGQFAQRVGQAETDHAPHLLPVGRDQTGAGKSLLHCLANRRLPVDQRAIAIEDDQAGHAARSRIQRAMSRLPSASI